MLCDSRVRTRLVAEEVPEVAVSVEFVAEASEVSVEVDPEEGDSEVSAVVE